MKLYVGNLNYETDQDALADLFRPHGEVTSAHIIFDRDTGRSRGFGFVEMSSKKEAVSAMNALSQTEVGGRNLVVNEARERTNRY